MDASKKHLKMDVLWQKQTIDLDPHKIQAKLHVDGNSQLVSIYASKIRSKIAAMYSVEL